MSISTAKQVCIIMATFEPNIVFLKKQIQSIVSQTYSNWVCIITDDGSCDVSYLQIRDIIKNDLRFSLITSGQRLGPVNNFEHGLNQANSGTQNFEYIALCDQDDIWAPNKLTRLVEILDTHSGVSLVHSDLALIDENDNLLAVSCWQKEHRKLDEINYETLVFRNVVTGCACMFRCSVLKTALAFAKLDFPPPYFHDVWLALHALYAGTIFSLNEQLVQYRQHGKNVVGVKTKHNIFAVIRSLFSRKLFLAKTRNAFSCRHNLVNDFLKSLRQNQRSMNEKTAQTIRDIEKTFLSNYLLPFSLRQFFRLLTFTFKFAKFDLSNLKNGLLIAISQYVVLKNKLKSDVKSTGGQSIE
jgi:glycosyltransferase involved in cell wall biosynthesis